MKHSVYGDLPELWTATQLKHVCEINPRLPQSIALETDTDVSFVPMSAVNETFGVIAEPETRTYSEVKRGFTPFINGDVLFAKITPSMQNGKAAVAANLANGVGFGSTEFHVFRPGPAILAEWVFALIRRPDFRSIAEANFTGTAGQQRVPTNFIENFPIPLPPLPEQQRIVEILWAADELRQLRAQANQRAEDLLPALFHEMFGAFTDKATGFSELAAVAEVVSGVAKGRKLRSDQIREVPYVRVANVQDGFLDLSEVKTIEASENEIALYRLEKDDVLLTEGGDFDKLGRGALWDADISDCIHQNHVFRVRPNKDKVHPHFFVQYLQTPFVKSYFLRAAKRTTNLASINLTQLRALPVPLIEMTVQERFAATAQTVNQISLDCVDGSQRMDELFQSLVARAFIGELTAAWREAHHEELAQAARERDELLAHEATTVVTAPAVEQLPLPLTQPGRAVHAALDEQTAALLAAAEARPAYFRPEELVGDNGLDLVQAEAGLRLLAALGFVRQVQLDNRRVWRLVDAIEESTEQPQELVG